MAEEYVESIIIRADNQPEAETPTFEDTDCDAVFNIEIKAKLKQILKSVQNDTHNRHDYVFEITEIVEIEKVE